MSLIEHFLCGITIVSIIFLLVFLPLIPAEEQETIFMQECIAKGGVPSLCIKKENIVEVGE